MNTPMSVCGNKKFGHPSDFRRQSSGFTLFELMIVMVIVAIGVALAVPSFKTITEKRQLTTAAEEIASFLSFAQAEAIKSNEQVTVSWYTPGGHNANWCVGVIEGGTACDCRETVTTESDFCAIDGNAYRLVQADFVDVSYEFMHMRPNTGNFAFDPVRGTITDASESEVIDNDYLFYVHSERGSGSSRNYELQIHANITGRIFICTDTDRRTIIGGFQEC